MNNTQRTESHDTLPARLLEMWDALDPVDAWRPPLKEAADEIERLQAQVAQQAAEVQRLKEHAVILAATAEEVERERCAKLCEEIESSAWALWRATADPTEQGRSIGAEHCADAIRAARQDGEQP